MLTKRIIACLDVDAGRVVKGVNFLNLRDAGDPAELARAHAESGADEIVLLDVSATSDGRSTLLSTVRRAARELFIPFTVGGGIRSLADAASVFDSGADKISINSAAVKRPELISEVANRYGSQAVVVAVDAAAPLPSSAAIANAEVTIAGGRLRTGKDVVEWAIEAQERGAGEILLTSMRCDGTGKGFDCDLTCRVSQRVQIPVIASGGAGTAAHFHDVFTRGCADAALAASIFHFGTLRMSELKQSLSDSGVPVRWPC
jgi:imidazole glycerol-phosphate synthase subunit HisF